MKIATLIGSITVAGALLGAQAVGAQADPFNLGENSPVKRIQTAGEDGGTFYIVYCQNGKRGAIEQYDDPPQVCVGPPRKCKPSWNLVLAAEWMCRNG